MSNISPKKTFILNKKICNQRNKALIKILEFPVNIQIFLMMIMTKYYIKLTTYVLNIKNMK